MPDTVVVPALTRSEFAELISAVGDGSTESKLSDAVKELVARLKLMGGENGKAAGELTLKIKFKYDRGAFDVDAAVTKKMPEFAHARTVLFLSPRGGLSRNNINQIDAFDAPVRLESKDRPSVALER